MTFWVTAGWRTCSRSSLRRFNSHRSDTRYHPHPRYPPLLRPGPTNTDSRPESTTMATPTPGKTGPSQQGRTPQALAASPPVSTPFSLGGAQVFSPHGPRSSPQQVKKSPANSATLAGHASAGPLNFDSPSAAAAMGSLGMPGGLDIGLDNVGVGGLGEYGLGVLGGEDEKLKRLDAVINILSVRCALPPKAPRATPNDALFTDGNRIA